MMNIHQDFKDELKKIRPDLATKFWLTNIDNMPNEDIIAKLIDMFSNQEELYNHRLVSDTWSDYYVNVILTEAKSIDDVFIRVNSGLFRWTWITELINTVAEESTEWELCKPNKVYRVCAPDKLRVLDLLDLRQYTWRHFMCIGYNYELQWAATPVTEMRANSRHRKVYCVDWMWNLFSIPQRILVPTTIKNLQEFEKTKRIEEIILQLKDTAKYDIERISEDYQNKLREFMNVSVQLQNKLAADFTEEANRIFKIQCNVKSMLEKNVMLTSVEYKMWISLKVFTVPLMLTAEDWASFPIWRYEININLINRWLKIYNLDIDSTSHYQHPHIQKNGDCCLWAWTDPLRQSYSKNDYITLVWWLLDYLQHLNSASTYISIQDFQNEHYSKFKYQVAPKIKVTTPVSSVAYVDTPVTIATAPWVVLASDEAQVNSTLTDEETTTQQQPAE